MLKEVISISMRKEIEELIIQSGILCNTCGENSPSYCAEALVDLLIDNGVVFPPCKKGDTVFYIEGSRILPGIVKGFFVDLKNNYLCVYVETEYSFLGSTRFGYWMFGNKVFRSKEEAELKLIERKTSK